MNTNTTFKYIASGLVLMSTSVFSQLLVAQEAAKVIFKSGNAIVKHADGKEEPLSKNSLLNAGDTIETRKGRVQFKTIDGGKVSLQPGTVFKFKKYAFSGKEDGSEYAITELVKGGLRTVTGVIGHKNRDRYQLKTPVATIGIRGTEYSLTYNNQKLVMSTLHGSVDVCNSAGCVNVITGQSATTNGANTKPIYTQEKAQVGAAPAAKNKKVFVKAKQFTQTASLFEQVESTAGGKVNESNKPTFVNAESDLSQTENILLNEAANNTYGPNGYDANGYDVNGFDVHGYDANGFNASGYNSAGYDANGYDANGYNSAGFNAAGFNASGYNAAGYDANGYNAAGYDVNGYDISGYNTSGFNASGFNAAGYDANGFNASGFNAAGYDANGYDANGFNVNGYNAAGFNAAGFNAAGYDANGFNANGYDVNGYDVHGYAATGYNASGYDANGYDIHGYNSAGYNAAGYDANGYNLAGYNINGYNAAGYDVNGFDINGYNAAGFNASGYNAAGYDVNGYNAAGYNAAGYNAAGYDVNGFNSSGYNAAGYDVNGFNISGFNVAGFDVNGYNAAGFDTNGYNINGYNPNRPNQPKFKNIIFSRASISSIALGIREGEIELRGNSGKLKEFKNVGTKIEGNSVKDVYVDEFTMMGRIKNGEFNGDDIKFSYNYDANQIKTLSYVAGNLTTASQLANLASLNTNISYSVIASTAPALVGAYGNVSKAAAANAVTGGLNVNFATSAYNYNLNIPQNTWNHNVSGSGTLSGTGEINSSGNNAVLTSTHPVYGSNTSVNNAAIRGGFFGNEAQRAGVQYYLRVNGGADSLTGAAVLGKD